MMEHRFTLILYLALLCLTGLLAGGPANLHTAQARSSAAPLPAGREALPPGATIETVLESMHQPVAMAFDPQGRLFYTEKDTGYVRLFANGTLQSAPVIVFTVNSDNERGLLGIAVDPDFSQNHYIYVYYTCEIGP